MAGNSVPAFFGSKGRTKRPPGLDVTLITDLSGSMQPFASFISSRGTIIALENALLSQGIGILSQNRYSFTTGADNKRTSLGSIELSTSVNGVGGRWAPGINVLNGTATLPNLVANLGGDTEDMGLASNLVAQIDRQYIPANVRIIIGGSDEQSYETAFVTSPAFPYRYVGVHTVDLTISEPAGPNPVPAGTLSGFVYTTDTTGVAVYFDGSTINYRLSVPVANVTATAASGSSGGSRQTNINRAKSSNGAIYKINVDFSLLGTSLGVALGQFLFENS